MWHPSGWIPEGKEIEKKKRTEYGSFLYSKLGSKNTKRKYIEVKCEIDRFLFHCGYINDPLDWNKTKTNIGSSTIP
jgi:hypothetical protein